MGRKESNRTNKTKFISTRSRLGLLPVNFCSFVTELWPLTILFPINIFRTNGQNWINFVYALICTRSGLGLLPVIFLKFVRVTGLD